MFLGGVKDKLHVGGPSGLLIDRLQYDHRINTSIAQQWLGGPV